MSGIDVYIDLAIKNLKKREESKSSDFDEKKSKREDELMTTLTKLYFKKVQGGILRASENGNRVKYMNFDREKCKANFDGLGTPAQVLGRWLKNMTDTKSKYLLEKDGVKLHLEGLRYNVWNNGAFTVKFEW
jgi:hypothetical protein